MQAICTVCSTVIFLIKNTHIDSVLDKKTEIVAKDMKNNISTNTFSLTHTFYHGKFFQHVIINKLS